MKKAYIDEYTVLLNTLTLHAELSGPVFDQVWDAVNMCFDAMPVAALIDEKIFCVHGGIPPPWELKGRLVVSSWH